MFPMFRDMLKKNEFDDSSMLNMQITPQTIVNVFKQFQTVGTHYAC
jgi:hypothetical protein